MASKRSGVALAGDFSRASKVIAAAAQIEATFQCDIIVDFDIFVIIPFRKV